MTCFCCVFCEDAHVPSLAQFVRSLTEECHRRRPGSSVLWYDSITCTGELKWQDELNENNWYSSAVSPCIVDFLC